MPGKTLSIFHALAAAALFGASVPAAKLLLGHVHPVLLASFLYLGSGIGLFIYRLLQRVWPGKERREAGLSRNDLPWLLAASCAGGIAAPIVLLLGLRHTPAATASLLLNFEGVATAVIAALAFREAVTTRIWSAVALVTLASIMLSLDPSGEWGFSIGALGVLAACAFWGIDNNLTRQISAKDPVSIVIVKGLAAGSCSLVLALALGASMPGPMELLLSLVLGTACYGFSIVFFILAMRRLGSIRTSAYFASAPFIGALLSFVVFRELPTVFFIISFPIMTAGVFLLFGERHSHFHRHVELDHTHLHRHDDAHHNHAHPGLASGQAHSHPHTHDAIAHEHPHTPGIHHRHTHD